MEIGFSPHRFGFYLFISVLFYIGISLLALLLGSSMSLDNFVELIPICLFIAFLATIESSFIEINF